MPGKTALIAPLGLTPGVVTATIHALIKQDDKPELVYTLSTAGQSAQNACKIIRRYIERLGITDYRPRSLPGKVEDITANTVDAFQTALNDILNEVENLRDAGEVDRVIVSVAGGRKTMTALVAVTAQFHKLDGLYDLWVDTAVERIYAYKTAEEILDILNDQLDLVNDDNIRALKPKDDEYELIPLPLLPLPNIYDGINAISNANLKPHDSRSQRQYLLNIGITMEAERINALLRSMPCRLTFEQGDELRDIEILCKHRSASRGNRIVDFLSNHVGLTGRLVETWATPILTMAKLSDDDFTKLVLDPITDHFRAINVSVPLHDNWKRTKEAIYATYDHDGDAAQYLCSLLLQAFKVGEKLEPISDTDRKRIGKVFLSYSHRWKAQARSINLALRDANVDAWWDEQIHLGDAWDPAIESAMEQCNSCVLLVTRSALRADGYILTKELEHFNRHRKLIIPVLLEKIAHNRLPDPIQKRLYLSAFNLTETEMIRRIVDRLVKG